MKIKVLMTDKAMQRPVMDDRERMLSAAVSPGVEISVDCIRKGPDELDCHTDEAFAAPELVKMAIQAEKDGYDAIVIYCFSDVGLEALRENVKIPVIAPGEVTLSVAQTLCSRFVVVTGAGWNIPRTYRRMMRNCIAREKMQAVLALDIPAEKMRDKSQCDQRASGTGLRGSGGKISGGRRDFRLSWHGRLRRRAGAEISGQGTGSGLYRPCLCGNVRTARPSAHSGPVSPLYQ